MLCLTRKKNEKIMIGQEIEVTVIKIDGNQVMLGIEAPTQIPIYREEVYREIERENLATQKIQEQTWEEILKRVKKSEKKPTQDET